ncbi:MAG: hypothetical protein M1814_001587 [Vezdaea aestivalis]|nr:MAG: hypothetical protein M1814_001587 [Vezdaea aestivalis]
MLFQPLALLSTAALTAAVLVPPNAFAEGAAPLSNIKQEEVVKVNCPGCFFPQKTEDGFFMWIEGVDNSLVLNFSIAGETSNQLFINDVPVFPVDMGFFPLIHAYQIRTEEPVSVVTAAQRAPTDRVPLELGIELATSSRDGLTNLHFAVVALNNVPVTGLDSAELTLSTNAETGALSIESMDLRPNTRAGASPTEQEKAGAEKECTTFPLLCKWKALISAKFHGAKTALRKGCMKLRPHTKPAVTAAVPDASETQPERPHRHEHAHPHHDYHKVHRTTLGKVMHVLRIAFMHVLLPVLFGIVAGMTGSLIGLIIGHFCVLVFRMVFRRGAKYERLEQDEEEAVCKECEVEALSDEDLPVYQAVADDYVSPVEKE